MVAKTSEMLTVREAQAAVDRLTEQVMRGEKVDAAELAGAKAMLEVTARRSEFDALAARKAKQEEKETAAAAGDEWLRAEVPALAERVLAAMVAAEEANRLLVAAVKDYQRGADRAVRQVEELRGGGTLLWPHGRGLLREVLGEVTASAAERPSEGRTPPSQRFLAALGRPSAEMAAAARRRAAQRARYDRDRAEAGRRAREQAAQACLDAVAKGVYHDPRDVAEAREILGQTASVR